MITSVFFIFFPNSIRFFFKQRYYFLKIDIQDGFQCNSSSTEKHRSLNSESVFPCSLELTENDKIHRRRSN